MGGDGPLELLQNWALGVCLACLAAGVLQQFFASRSGVIKLVLTLYILVTALGTAGLAEDGLDGITDAFEARPGQSQPAVDVQSLTLAQAQAALEQTLFQSLAEGGVAAQDVSVQLAASGTGEVTVEQVTAVVLNEASGPAAKALIQSVLGQQVSVTAVTPGREGDGT